MTRNTAPTSTSRPRARVVAVVAALVASALSTLSPNVAIDAVPPAANPADVTSAIRYNASGHVPGSVIRSLTDVDDDVTTYPGAWPANFFGTKYDNLCITTNGGAFFTNSAAIVTDATSAIANGGCSNSYDYSTSYMALQSAAPFISVLATDHDTGNDVAVTPSWEIFDPQISTIVGAAGTVTVTMAEAHGFTVGSQVSIGGTSAFNGAVTVVSVPSSTTFTYSAATTGSESAGSAKRLRVYGNLASVSGDGTTVTVTTSGNHLLGTGDYVTFAGTGIVAIDDKHFQITRTGATTFTFPQPTGFDTSTAVDLTADYKWFQSDGYGAIGQLYFGTMTISGRSAQVITWYRVPMYQDDNPRVRFSTIQLVFVQKASGNGTVGWDFDVEFNYGTMTDDEDGYEAWGATDGEGERCGSWDSTPPGGAPAYITSYITANGGAPPAKCRWGIGWASYKQVTDAQSWKIEYCATQCLITINTATAHGLSGGDLVKAHDVNGAPFQGDYLRALSGTGGTKLLLVEPGNYTGYTDTALTDLTAGGATRLDVSEDYEIFPYTWIGHLVEQSAGTTTRMTTNNMNAPTVPGRYTFQMVGGKTVGFERPSMGRPSAPRALTAYYNHYPYDPTRATVNFQPSLSNGGNAITSYTVRMIPDTGAGDCVINLPSPLKCVFTGLVSTQTYKVEVFATNSTGDSNVTVADVGFDPGEPLTEDEEDDATKGPTSEPKPYVGADGQPPQLPPGNTVMYVGGEPIDLNLAPTRLSSGLEVLRLSSSGSSTGAGKFEMTIGGDCPTCSLSQDNSGNNVLGMSQSAAVRVGGYGFKPSSQVNVFVSSTTRLLGFFKADGDGAFLGSVKVPTDLPSGNHTIQVSGFTADNVIRSVSVGITVAKTAPKGCRTTKVKGKTRTVCPKKPVKKKVAKKK